MIVESVKRLRPGPEGLRQICTTKVGQILVTAVWPYIRNHHVEQQLRDWLDDLPTHLRQDLLDRCSTSLLSTIGRVSELSSKTVPVLLASLMEIIYSPSLSKIDIWTDFHWHKESRMKVLHLLHSQQSSAKKLEMSCYKTPIYQFQTLPFSERFLLMNIFNKLEKLRQLSVPYVADDDLLLKLGGGCCPQLEALDVQGSWEVTNQGLANLAGHDGRMVIGRVGWVPSHFTQCKEGQKLLGDILKGSPVKVSQLSGLIDNHDKESGIVKSLRYLNIEQTATDSKGLETVLQNFKQIKTLKADEVNWQHLLVSICPERTGMRGGSCSECLPSNMYLTGSINLATHTYSLLSPLSGLLPNLSHLTISNYERSEVYLDGQDNLPLLASFPKLTSLHLKDVDMEPIYRVLGELDIRKFRYNSRVRPIDLSLLSSLCPSLTEITIISSLIKYSQDVSTTKFTNLTNLQFRDIVMEGSQECWKKMILSCPQLKYLSLHNVRLTEADLTEVLVHPLTKTLEEVNISTSPGNTVNLTEETVFNLIDKCPRLKKIGGICGWSVQDLSYLLHILSTKYHFSLKMDDSGD